MKIIRDADELRLQLAGLRNERIALVPTMGCLHEGHLSLIRKAKRLADIVVVSVYVNPLQFGPNEDFSSYPRTFNADADLCREQGVDIIFHPENLYPHAGPQVTLKVSGLDEGLCGTNRPGHFDGMATVVNILFNIVQPDLAIFGEKDWQQLTIIRRMASDLHMPVEIVGSETLREEDGLAMSSRNRYLNADERRQATALFAALEAMHKQAASGEQQVAALLQTGATLLDQHGIVPEYLEIRHEDSLAPIDSLDEGPARAFVAARVGPARLIDNLSLS
jgi:pantoate--beta-alanine ligase